MNKKRFPLKLHLAGLAQRSLMVIHGFDIGGFQGVARNSFTMLRPHTGVLSGYYFNRGFGTAFCRLYQIRQQLGLH